jgi:hypothetical protein
MKKKVTAAELLQRLNADPGYLARRAQEDQVRARAAEERKLAEAPLVKELRAAGVEVNSAWDITKDTPGVTRALPILQRHLELSYPDAVREGIARALATPQARFAWKTLARLYRTETGTRTRDGLAVALAAMADAGNIEQLAELAEDRRNGPSRVLLIRALAGSSSPRAREALSGLRSDPEVSKEVARLTRRARSTAGGAGPLPRTGDDLSSNFDVEQVRPFLRLLSEVLDLRDDQVEKIVEAVEGTAVEDETEIEVPVR